MLIYGKLCYDTRQRRNRRKYLYQKHHGLVVIFIEKLFSFKRLHIMTPFGYQSYRLVIVIIIDDYGY